MSDTIRVKDLKDQLSGQQPPLVIDVRDGDSYLVGHIPGAMNIPLKRLEYRPDSEPDDRPIVLYGHEDDAKKINKESLDILTKGHVKVMMLEGGFKAWREAGYPEEVEDNQTHDVNYPKDMGSPA